MKKKKEISLTWGRMLEFGFEWQGMFVPAQREPGIFSKWVGRHCLYVDSLYYPGTIGFFTLTPAQLKKFKENKACLQAPGFCSPSAMGREIITTFQTVHTGPVKDHAHLERILQVITDQTS